MSKGEERASDLTHRERAVLEFIRKGLTNAEVAQQLEISAATVKAHSANIYRKLNVSNRTEAVGLGLPELGASRAPPPSPPAVAVRPFWVDDADNLQCALADAIVDDLICRLGRCWFPVIARCSSFALERDELVDARTIGQTLNARFLVEGSFRRSSRSARINVRLVETSNAHVLWAERYEFDIQRTFTIQDELCAAVAAALSDAVIEHVASEALDRDRDRGSNGARAELQPWENAALGMWCFWKGTRQEHELARRWFAQALAQNPSLKLALYGSALAHQREILEQWGTSAEEAKTQLASVSARFISRHPDDPWANLVAAYVGIYSGDRKAALARVRFALEREPSSVRARSLHGQLLAMAGDTGPAIAEIQRAIELSPRAPDRWTQECVMALAHFAGRDYENAIKWAQISAQAPHAGTMPFGVLASSYAHLGDMQQAKVAAAEIHRRAYSFNEGRFGTLIASTEPEIAQRYLDGLRKATA